MFSLSEIMDLKVLLNSIKQCHQNSISGLHGDNGSIRVVTGDVDIGGKGRCSYSSAFAPFKNQCH